MIGARWATSAATLLGLLAPPVAHGGAWTRPLGSHYAKVGADWFVSRQPFVPDGAEGAVQRFVGHHYGGYLEVGLSPKHPVQLAISAPVTVGVATFEQSDSFQRATGSLSVTRPGDLRVRPQIALHRTLPLAAAVEARVPLYRIDGICEGDPLAGLCPRPGDGQVDITGWLLAGAALAGTPLWGEIGLGYVHRTAWFLGWDTPYRFGDGAAWSAAVGAQAGPALLMVKGDGVQPWVADDITARFARVGPAVLVDVHAGLALEGRLQVDLATRAISRGVGFGVGVSHRR